MGIGLKEIILFILIYFSLYLSIKYGVKHAINESLLCNKNFGIDETDKKDREKK